ncbi:hypothetical protein [Brevibacterium ihuae]|uniref:hypothetical protein n=1 Tax=Brevibacterium ihuae TaxID=1631743 RepID=UPI000C75AA33|nr:hypothetical protein [Brevibacterium ihuae]
MTETIANSQLTTDVLVQLTEVRNSSESPHIRGVVSRVTESAIHGRDLAGLNTSAVISLQEAPDSLEMSSTHL